jgi:phage FluMu protein Com
MTEDRPDYDEQPTQIFNRHAHRCVKCGRIIAIGVVKEGTVLEIKCRCNQMNILKAA